ncbi:hypothetical protein PVAP13_2NG408900 [Panicum virgatum]|uniref:Uncharacterized protein n=1 Tax=Panicum virgatum TaxID=38727 RepID=A0A8T0VGS0_PANVG|nr:hypothetical protein PVAP13_2NG408900 [Panicum virgatum]
MYPRLPELASHRLPSGEAGLPLADPAGPCAAGSCATPARPCSTSSRAAITRPCATEDPFPATPDPAAAARAPTGSGVGARGSRGRGADREQQRQGSQIPAAAAPWSAATAEACDGGEDPAACDGAGLLATRGDPRHPAARTPASLASAAAPWISAARVAPCRLTAGHAGCTERLRRPLQQTTRSCSRRPTRPLRRRCRRPGGALRRRLLCHPGEALLHQLPCRHSEAMRR